MSRRSNRNTDSKRYFDWLFHAYQDLLAAKNLIKDKRLYDAVVFHCQQAMEKALKGYMLYKTRRLFDGHNVTWLCKQAALIDDGFRQWISKSTCLNRYYIETRYPADIPVDIPFDEANDILEAAEELMDYACEQIKFDFNSYHRRSKKK